MTDEPRQTDEFAELSEAEASDSAALNIRRAETLLNAKRTLELADKMKLVSLNVAIESAKTRGVTFDVQRLKQELSDLTNQAVKASKDVAEVIAAISELGDGESASPAPARRTHQENEFRRAIRLRKELDELLVLCSDVIDRLERMAPSPGRAGSNPNT
ncbi:MAG TPA: hypothetical protein VLB27_10390 [candidate division Zixibacteria bacterium]|nr:hypothetical protein [candidate division Zixibacteria bacterium]